MRLARYRRKEGNYIVAHGWSLLGGPYQFTAVTQDPEHVGVLSVYLRVRLRAIGQPGFIRILALPDVTRRRGRRPTFGLRQRA